MSFEFYIAKRYLLSKRKISFITIISLISILGLTVGTAALIIVLSVFNGFNVLVTSILVGFDPHIRIEVEHNKEIAHYDSLERILNENSKIKAISPFISEKAMVLFGTYNRAIFIKGVDAKKIGEVTAIKEKMISGKFEFEDSPNIKSIVLGSVFSDRLGALKGDTIYIVSSSGMESSLTQFSSPTVLKFQVIGVFESNNKDYDSYYGYVSLQSARELFSVREGIKGIEIHLDNIINSEQIKQDLQLKLSKSYVISTWYDLHRDLYSAMKIERWIAYIILCIIIMVAVFNILGSLTMTVIEKKRDIGVLKAMGCTRKSILRLFMFEGILIGAVGTVLGSLLGLCLCVIQQELGIFPLDQSFVVATLPVEIRWTDFVTVAAASMFLSILATFYPALRAASLSPIDTIRWE